MKINHSAHVFLRRGYCTLVLFLLGVPSGLHAEEQETTKKKRLAHEEVFKDKQYPTAFECKPCHPVQFRQWSVSQHAYSNLSPAFISNDNNTQLITNGTAGDTCTRCHNPVGARMGLSSAVSNMKREQKNREGVTCIVCHRRNKRFSKISGRFLPEEGEIFGRIFGPSDNTVQKETEAVESLKLTTSPDKEGRAIHAKVEQDPLIRQPVFCAPCHGARLPTQLRSEETFDEYKTSKDARDNVTCQDCHMGKVPGDNKGFDEGPAAIIGEHKTRSRRISNHYFAGPDFPVLHPGIFPHNPDAVQIANYEEWLLFDHKAGWGTPEFENNVPEDYKFPQFWDDPDLRVEARKVITENQELLKYAWGQREAILKEGYKVEAFELEKADARSGLKFRIKVKNGIDAHNVPSGFTHERVVFLQITVADSKGNAVFRSGDRDPNGDLREHLSLYVVNRELPLDTQIFNLQSHFILKEIFGGERSQVSFFPFSMATLMFVRPPTNATTILAQPNEVRVMKRSIEPSGHRWAHYHVDPDLLRKGEVYTLEMKLIAQQMAGFFFRGISAVGFDYQFSLRELVDRTVKNSVVVWERKETVTIQ
ncbi:MAG: hypothetical protein HYU36_14870 [Planctomycetes bacterium]|nr:hypothetical protein [Planctomycetota bacterium]